MDMRTGHGYQGRTMHSHSMDHGQTYKQLVKYCCGFLSSSTIVATTRLVSNSSTISKSQRQISSREYELCNSQENLIGNYNSILPTIYMSIHGPYYDCALSYPNVHALSSCPLLICLISYYSSTMCLPQGQHVVYICSDIIP